MFNMSYRITRIWGIPIKVHITLVVLPFIFIHFFNLIYGLMLTLGLLVSIVLHELGHSFVAIRKGCHVREITLMFMGGAAQMDQIPTRPLDEILMALAGPAVSLIVGQLCIVAGGQFAPDPMAPYELNIIELLGSINMGLAYFNILPAFPMDGGRVLRAALTPKLGRLKATFYAARLGKIMAVLFGVISLVTARWMPELFSPMLPIVAIFIYILAGQEYRMVQREEAAKTNPFAGNSWAPFTGAWRPPAEPHTDDRVIIGPPPYRKEPASEAELRPLQKKNPFSDLFGS